MYAIRSYYVDGQEALALLGQGRQGLGGEGEEGDGPEQADLLA